MNKKFDFRKNIELIENNYGFNDFEKAIINEFICKINEDIVFHDDVLSEEKGQEVFEQIVDSFIDEDSFYEDFMDNFSDLIYKYIDEKRDEIKKKKENEKKEYLIKELSQVNSDEFIKIMIEVEKKRLDNK